MRPTLPVRLNKDEALAVVVAVYAYRQSDAARSHPPHPAKQNLETAYSKLLVALTQLVDAQNSEDPP
jgi:hypothetical protein